MTRDAHVPDELLQSFVACDLTDEIAAHVALHLDACPSCATRAVTLDPLATAFAVMPDPIVPADLADAVLDELARPQSSLPWVEVSVGLTLLVGAAFIVLAFDDPVAQTTNAALFVGMAGRALDALDVALPSLLALLPWMFAAGAVGALSLLQGLAPDRLQLALGRQVGRT